MRRQVAEFVLVMLLVGISFGSLAATITVPDDYPSIQAAIDAAQAGDTVYIKAGEYTENLVIDKPLSLVGEDQIKVIIRSSDLEADVISLLLGIGEASIEGLTVIGGGTGVFMRVEINAEASLNKLITIENKIGIGAGGAGKMTIVENYIIDSEEVGLLLAGGDFQIERNEILRCGRGILLTNEVEAEVRENLIGLCDLGIGTYPIRCGDVQGGMEEFRGKVRGAENRVYGTVDVCPSYQSNVWPEGLIDLDWRKTIGEAASFYDHGVRMQVAQDHRGACESYEAGRALLDEASFLLMESYINHNLGVVYVELGQHEKALEVLEFAREAFASYQLLANAAGINENMGIAFSALGRYENALSSYDAARTVYVDREMEINVAKIDVNIATVYAELGHYEKALATYQLARGVLDEHMMVVDVASVDHNIGNVYSRLGLYDEALASLERARAVFLAHVLDVTVARVDTSIGAVYRQLGRLGDALAAYESARVTFATHGMDVDVAWVGQNVGVVYEDLGRYEEALAVYQTSRDVFISSHQGVLTAKVDTNIGNVYSKLGLYERALEQYHMAQTVFLALQMEVDAAKLGENIATVYSDLGRFEEALAKYQSARAVYVGHEMDVNVANVDQNIGIIYTNLGLYHEALEAYETAHVIYLVREMQVKMSEAKMAIGIVHRKLGEYEQALAAYQDALAILNRMEPVEGMTYSYPATRWMIHANRGVCYEELSEWDQARGAYEDSIAVIESIRSGFTSEDIKQAWQEQTQDVYERLIDLLYRMGEGASAFAYAERCRARIFLDTLYGGGVSPDQLISPEAGISSGAVDPEVIAQAVDDAQDMLLPNEAVLEYMVTDSGVYVWVVTGEGIADPEFIEYPREQLMNDVITLRKAIEGSSPDPITSTQFLESFYEKLVQDSLATLPDGVDTLIIIPSGPLWYVPFSALMMVDGEAVDSTRVPYLVEHYTLAYLPSLASLPSLAQKDAAASTSLLALADPERSLVRVYESGKSPCGDETALGRYEVLVDACQAFADQLLGEEQATQWVYSGEEAQEALAHQATGRQVVVYAAHGQFNAYVPLQSKLLLAPSEETETADSDRRNPDGNYHAWEVLLTDYRGTELAVLAACETLLPHLNDVTGTMAVMSDQTCDEVDLTPQQLEKIVVGDEVVGLARAFLSSGAEAVVGTLWLANPYAIEELLVSMAKYYKQGATWVEALTRAQRDLISNPTFGNVWFWAPYQLIGRWR